MKRRADRILVIGCTSKIAKLFLDTYCDDYEFYGTYHSTLLSQIAHVEKSYNVDLGDTEAVLKFVDSIKHLTFRAVLFFASTYDKDKTQAEDFTQQVLSDQLVNVLSPCLIARSINYQIPGRVIFFGDAGLNVPKPHHLSYSVSKLMLDGLNKLLAVELKDRAISLCFKLGPTLASSEFRPKSSYYDKNLISVTDVPLGLVEYLNFVIEAKNFNATGAEIVYDGGAYLRRA